MDGHVGVGENGEMTSEPVGDPDLPDVPDALDDPGLSDAPDATGPSLVFDDQSMAHSAVEDVLGILTGTFVASLGLYLLRGVTQQRLLRQQLNC